MSELNESERPSSRRNPLIWIALVVIGLILFLFLSADRGKPPTTGVASTTSEAVGEIDRSLLVPAGMRARQYIQQIRAAGKPYALAEAYDKAGEFLQSGSLADAHLLYFFGAREGHLPAIMKMGEMSDPTLFRAEDSLLDHADPIQAYKWYQKAADMGHLPAADRVTELHFWAIAESRFGNADARQLLLNF